MADTQLHEGKPEEFVLPYPASWTFPERIPKHAVDDYINRHHELGLHKLPFEDVRELVAKECFRANYKKLEECPSAHEKDKYYLEEQKIGHAIDEQKNREDAGGRADYHKRSEGLIRTMMENTLSVENARIFGENAKALAAIDRILKFEEDKKQQKEFKEFLRASAKRHIENNRE